MTKVPYSSELIQSKPRKLLFVYNSFLLVCLAMHSLNYKFNYTVGAVELVALVQCIQQVRFLRKANLERNLERV